MEAKLELIPEPGKTLADFPGISADYARMPQEFLPGYLTEYQKRARYPQTDWDRKFARFHVEALEMEIAERTLRNAQELERIFSFPI